jgi:hypothetical protein
MKSLWLKKQIVKEPIENKEEYMPPRSPKKSMKE